MKFVAVRTEPTPERPHGRNYSLTLQAPDGSRMVGFDNAHPARERRGPGRAGVGVGPPAQLRTIRLYSYEDVATLLEDFWNEVDQILRERGAIP